ncbi:hypothetical protein GCM10027605_67990 [Micromonospora zhanjiangensis]
MRKPSGDSAPRSAATLRLASTNVPIAARSGKPPPIPALITPVRPAGRLGEDEQPGRAGGRRGRTHADRLDPHRRTGGESGAYRLGLGRDRDGDQQFGGGHPVGPRDSCRAPSSPEPGPDTADDGR